MAAKNFKETTLYKMMFAQAMDILETSKSFPKEETYSLTDQIRRSSRSVCSNLAEAYRKKRYPAHFISKVTDCDAENAETNVWLDFSEACNYISKEKHQAMILRNEEIGRLIYHMLNNPDKY
ncbi:MAG TPA: four helix bundle protein [Chitinophagaceae bacterium]